jgi:hypothetical protein
MVASLTSKARRWSRLCRLEATTTLTVVDRPFKSNHNMLACLRVHPYHRYRLSSRPHREGSALSALLKHLLVSVVPRYRLSSRTLSPRLLRHHYRQIWPVDTLQPTSESTAGHYLLTEKLRNHLASHHNGRLLQNPYHKIRATSRFVTNWRSTRSTAHDAKQSAFRPHLPQCQTTVRHRAPAWKAWGEAGIQVRAAPPVPRSRNSLDRISSYIRRPRRAGAVWLVTSIRCSTRRRRRNEMMKMPIMTIGSESACNDSQVGDWLTSSRP